MGARKTARRMTLLQALQMLQGERPPVRAREEWDEFRWDARQCITRFRLLLRMNEPPLNDTQTRPLPTAAQWADVAALGVDNAAHAEAVLGAPREVGPLLEWIASAPEKYVGVALEVGIWREANGHEKRLIQSLLRGDAGSFARAAVSGLEFPSTVFHHALMNALLKLPQLELETVTSGHAGEWPCYSDRLIACSATWKEHHNVDLFKAMSRISSEYASGWAVWHEPRCVIHEEAVQLLARLPPSPEMMEVVARFGRPEVARELMAARINRQLCAEIPGKDDDAIPQAEMI